MGAGSPTSSSLPSGNTASTNIDSRILRLAGLHIWRVASEPRRRGGSWAIDLDDEQGLLRRNVQILTSGNPLNSPDFPPYTEERDVYGIVANMRGSNGVSPVLIGLTGMFDAAALAVTRVLAPVVSTEDARSTRGIYPYVHYTDGRPMLNESGDGPALSRIVIRGNLDVKQAGDADVSLWVSDLNPQKWHDRFTAHLAGTTATYTTKLYPKDLLAKSKSRFRVNLVGDTVALRIGRIQSTLTKNSAWTTTNQVNGIPFNSKHDIYDGAFEPADERLILGGAFMHNYVNASLLEYVKMLSTSVSHMTQAFRRMGELLNRAFADTADKVPGTEGNTHSFASKWRTPSKADTTGTTSDWADWSPRGNGFAHSVEIKASSTPVNNGAGQAVQGLALSSTGILAGSPGGTSGAGVSAATGSILFKVTDPRSVEYLYGVLWEIGSILGGYKPDGSNRSSGVGEKEPIVAPKQRISGGTAFQAEHLKFLDSSSTGANDGLNPLMKNLNSAFGAWRTAVNERAPRKDGTGRMNWETAPGLGGNLANSGERATRMYLHPEYYADAAGTYSAITDAKVVTEAKVDRYVVVPPYPWWEKCMSALVHISPISMDPQESLSLHKFEKGSDKDSTGANYEQPSQVDKHWRNPRAADGKDADGKEPYDDVLNAVDVYYVGDLGD